MFAEGVRPVFGRVLRHFRAEGCPAGSLAEGPPAESSALETPAAEGRTLLALQAAVAAPDQAGESTSVVETGSSEPPLPGFCVPDETAAYEQEQRTAKAAAVHQLALELAGIADQLAIAALNLSLEASRLGAPGAALMAVAAEWEQLAAQSRLGTGRLLELLCDTPWQPTETSQTEEA